MIVAVCTAVGFDRVPLGVLTNSLKGREACKGFPRHRAARLGAARDLLAHSLSNSTVPRVRRFPGRFAVEKFLRRAE